MSDHDPPASPALLRPLRFVLPALAYAALIPAVLFAGHTHSEFVHEICSKLGAEVNTTLIFATVFMTIGTALKLRKTRPLMIWWAFDCFLGSVILVDGQKLIGYIPIHGHELGLLRPNGSLYGYPSGHTALMFSLSWLVYEMYPTVGVMWYALAVLVGWSRVVVDAHYPYQVLTSAPMGFLVGWGVTHLPGGLFLPRFVELAAWLRGKLMAAKAPVNRIE